MRNVPLSEIASIQQGVSRFGRGAGAQQGPWRVRLATTSDIQDDRLVPERLATINIEQNERTERYLIQPGDILVSARATRMKAALVPTRISATVADAGLLVVRGQYPFVPLGPYLWWYLTSSYGRQQVEALMVGATVQSLPMRSLAELEIPMPADEELFTIAELTDVSEQAYALAIEAAVRRRDLVRDAVIGRFRQAAEKQTRGAAPGAPSAGAIRWPASQMNKAQVDAMLAELLEDKGRDGTR